MIIKLLEFGSILTGRDKGKGVMNILMPRLIPGNPVEIDMYGIISMGSSFGDEVFPKIASTQQGLVKVSNAAPSVRHCLSLIAEDAKIKIEYVP